MDRAGGVGRVRDVPEEGARQGLQPARLREVAGQAGLLVLEARAGQRRVERRALALAVTRRADKQVQYEGAKVAQVRAQQEEARVDARAERDAAAHLRGIVPVMADDHRARPAALSEEAVERAHDQRVRVEHQHL